MQYFVSRSIKNKALIIFSGFFLLTLVMSSIVFVAIKNSQEDAEITNALGRQRMLAQAMGKSVFAYEMAKSMLQIIEQQANYLNSYISKMRIVYTDKIVQPARKTGLGLSMDPDREKHSVIPFPATFTRMVNEKFLETENFSVDILSEDPINPKQSLSSDIDREGFAYLKANPDKHFRKVFEQQGKLMVNIYTPDKATTEGCVSCHASIKNKQYEIGDILGMRKFSLVYSEDVVMGKAELNADLGKFTQDKNLFASTLMALQSGGVISLDRGGARIKPVKPVEDPEFQKQLKLVQAQFKSFTNLTDALVDRHEVSSVQFRRLYLEMLKLSDILTEESDALTNIFVKVADRNQQYIKAVVMVSAVLTLFLLFSLYLYLNRSVLSPVVTVSNTLSHLAKGDLEQTLITYISKDEIGDLSISSNQLISQLKTFIESTANTLAGKPQNENNDSELSGEFYSSLEEIREQVQARKKAQKELENAHEQLEMKVEKRTTELIKSNTTMVREITKRQEMEESLKEINGFLENILNSPHNISIISTDLEKKIIYWNKGAESLLGYKAEEVVNKKNIDILYPDNHESSRSFSEMVEKAIEEKCGKSIEVEELTKYHDKIWVRMTVSPRFDDKGQVVGILSIGENITQQKYAEMELKESEARFRMILDTAYDAFISINEDGRVIDWNLQAEQMFGWRKEEVVNKKVSELIIPEDLLETYEKSLKRFLEENPSMLMSQKLEVAALNRQGKGFPVEITVTPLRFQGGVIFNAFVEDISERKLMTAQLNHAQKMESIGQLAAGIAHEINTPLQYIGDNTRFLQDSFLEMIDIVKEYKQQNENRLADSNSQGETKPLTETRDLNFLVDEIPAAIQQSLDGVGRVTKIVQAMKEFSHPGSEDKKLTNINKAIETTRDVSRNIWKYVANIETELDPQLPLVPCYADEMNQVFLNLIVNAAHAIEEKNMGEEGQKGTITISTRQNNGWVEICIKDTGKGIPKKHGGKIFDPFFTTKEVGKGTGQGLSIVHTVITKKHNGEISFQSKVNEGTSFLLRLPI